MRRYIVTGAPGAGKTAMLAALRDRGYAVIAEAATDVIAWEHARGGSEPWRGPGFVDAIVRLQGERQRRPAPPGTAVELYDRSPICTLALARHLGRPVTGTLAGEVDRVVRDGVYERRVFFVHLLGFVTPTAARRITFEEAARFERVHEQAYREHGFELVDVPPATIDERVELVDRHVRAWAE